MKLNHEVPALLNQPAEPHKYITKHDLRPDVAFAPSGGRYRFIMHPIAPSLRVIVF